MGYPKLTFRTSIKLDINIRLLQEENSYEVMKPTRDSVTSEPSNKHQCMAVDMGAKHKGPDASCVGYDSPLTDENSVHLGSTFLCLLCNEMHKPGN